MGFWERLLGKKSKSKSFEKQTEEPITKSKDDMPNSVELLFESISEQGTKKRLIELIKPELRNFASDLPEEEDTSVRLNNIELLSVSGGSPTIVELPASLIPVSPNIPYLLSLAGMARAIIDLKYSGVQEEAPEVIGALKNNSFKYRFSYLKEKNYPIIRIQLQVIGNLSTPLDIEATPDILDSNVQDFFTSLSNVGSFELSVHVLGKYQMSKFIKLNSGDQENIFVGIESLVNHLNNIDKNNRMYLSAVSEFENKHPLGEGL